MIQKFIVVGPINGLYHACYRIPGTKEFSSYEACESKGFCQKRVDALNSDANIEDKVVE